MSDGPPIWSETDPRYQPPPEYPGPPAQPETGQTCLSCDKPAVWISPTGHDFCQECRELYASVMPSGYRFDQVDLDELMSSDPPKEVWFVDPILPKGKLVGITSPAGHGKSLLGLDVALKKATGEKILDQDAGPPEHVLYLDMEMGPDELYDRLNDLGYSRDHSLWQTVLDHLHYYQLIALPPLNTVEGGQALEEIVDRHHPTLLVIDTLARVIIGSENDAESYQELFRHTETMLKRRGITLVRLDHLGKDITKGSRGSSAKADGLDVVWQMTQVVEGTMQFKRIKGRQVWVPEKATIHRLVVNGIVSHTTDTELAPQWLVDLAWEMDRLGIPVEVSTPTAQQMLREAGKGRRRTDVIKAVRFRQRNTGTPWEHPSGTVTGTPGNTLQETQQTLGETGGNTHGNTPEQSGGVFPSLKEGTPPDQESEEVDFEDWDYLAATFTEFNNNEETP